MKFEVILKEIDIIIKSKQIKFGVDSITNTKETKIISLTKEKTNIVLVAKKQKKNKWNIFYNQYILEKDPLTKRIITEFAETNKSFSYSMLFFKILIKVFILGKGEEK